MWPPRSVPTRELRVCRSPSASASRLPERSTRGAASCVAPPNLAAWHEVPLAARVSEALDLPTFLERDTNVAVLAEWRTGAARGAGTVVYITVSTGVGGAAIIDRRPLVGPDGMAGEMGHIVVELDGPLCGCGGAGHVEAIASGTALAREARALIDCRRLAPAP